MLTDFPHEIARRAPIVRERRGQSFVELALVLPVLLIIVAGIVEVGNILTVYNRVQLAAREGARFGAAGGSDIGEIVEQTSSESLEWDGDMVTVWTIRPSVDFSTTPPQWQNATVAQPWGADEECIFGDNCASFSNPLTPDRVIADLDEIDIPSGIDSTNVTLVVVVVRYEVDTLLNLQYFQPGDPAAEGRTPVWAYSVMVQEVDAETVNRLSGGCSAYPIMLNSSLIPDGVAEGDTFTASVNTDPTGGGSTDGFGFAVWQWSRFDPSHNYYLATPSCSDASPGSLCTSTVSLRSDIGYIEPTDSTDTQLHRGDWVLSPLNSSSAFSSTTSLLGAHRDAERALRIILYNTTPTYVDLGYLEYQIVGFAVVNVYAVGGSSITFEWVRWDSSCGYDIEE